MLPNALDSFSNDEISSKWLIVGKGPSFNSEKIKEFKQSGYKLCSLNNAFSRADVDFDIIVCHDITPMSSFSLEDIKSTRCFVPSGIHSNLYPYVNNWDSLNQILSVVNKLRPVLYGFNIHNLGCLFHGYTNYNPPVVAHTSVSESACQILILAGVKYLQFIGIDGGLEYHQEFGPRHFRVDLSCQFSHLAKIKQTNIDVVFSGLPIGYGLNSNEEI